MTRTGSHGSISVLLVYRRIHRIIRNVDAILLHILEVDLQTKRMATTNSMAQPF